MSSSRFASRTGIAPIVVAAFLAVVPQALAQTTPQPAAPPPDQTGASTVLPMITVVAPQQLEAMPTDAASEQRISGETLNARPIARPSDLLEAVPGLIVSQHSGEGKANQYFLRGMNLDHGTDLALWLDEATSLRPAAYASPTPTSSRTPSRWRPAACTATGAPSWPDRTRPATAR
ncbi:MAG: hypothetical protein EBY18_00680 [Alphaproteobacteria bacterium]|nr:hypothetical protein [Alphaproteobacteria bacterium]